MPSGSKARIRANIAAVQLLRALQDAQRPATPAEQRVLATWSGWGAVPQVFDPRASDLTAERDTLAELLDRDQYRQAEASILNAHYTDPAIAAVVWEALGRAGFSGGKVLEPAIMRNFCVSRDTRSRMTPRAIAARSDRRRTVEVIR
ncbi:MULTISPECIES: hypothetical protein [unclassified Mycobacteroides]|uniref:hypothetical protein n=1 Tax=unclassified Mycobacteroides TaxID=2618759 RepID=UPI0007126C16|nr:MULTISPECIES: hypothetical protein [unclassified Mycobacteroides]KRQ19668.1 hypothetical protein AOT91_27780 [Mycobacteroides sp. H092]KRQ21593.1 hypothetical protein AOT87_15900 [Mycobacteroides sp. H003]KRQ41361.1 hypothetical protein AOT92_12485 [Mycobacteroides sp. H101]KRQ42811.1 hypothetical protein AOT88_24955 [Mycobacteroides sp. H063]KRQ63151.1 hypothetical protein AOT90_13575 [Mycobacteroides sp. H079]